MAARLALLNRKAQSLSDFDVLNVEKSNTTKRTIFNHIEPTIYFANEKVLNRLTKENFYIALNETLFEHFDFLKGSAEKSEDRFQTLLRVFNNLETLKKKIVDKIGNDDSKNIRNEFERMIQEENKMLDFLNTIFQKKKLNEIISGFDKPVSNFIFHYSCKIRRQ